MASTLILLGLMLLTFPHVLVVLLVNLCLSCSRSTVELLYGTIKNYLRSPSLRLPRALAVRELLHERILWPLFLFLYQIHTFGMSLSSMEQVPDRKLF